MEQIEKRMTLSEPHRGGGRRYATNAERASPGGRRRYATNAEPASPEGGRYATNTARSMERVGVHMVPGEVYWRAELVRYSKCVDRDLKRMVDAGKIKKLWRGAYYRPEVLSFGKARPLFNKIMTAFLRDDNFLLTSLDAYNSLNVGTTQLYNEHIVYNKKRSGRMKVCGQNCYFIRNRDFPKKPTLEFHYVDLINNMDMLAEEQGTVKALAAKNVSELDTDKVRCAARTYGKAATIKFFDQLYQDL